MVDNSSKLEFVEVDGKEYSRMLYADGTAHYTVKTSQLNQYCRYVWRKINSPVTQAKIDKAIEEKKK